MFDLTVVELSRLQFALTAMFHFIFVPLTLGMSILLGIMETVYVMTKRSIWRDMTKFWGVLFGINFAMGVATGITMEFQFGTNWAYYAHYVGDIFGVPLAIEGLMAFFLEGTFIGLFFFGWNRMSKPAHLMVTWLVAIGSNFSALWILIANGWMQHPVGAHFDFQTMRMEVDSFSAVLFNHVAQTKFVHTVSAGYVTGAVFVMAVSAFYLLRRRNIELAKRSIIVAAAFGLASALSVVILGDESGYLTTQNQQMKLAAIEGMWDTEAAPASFNIVGIPDQKDHVTRYTLKVPYMLGIIATRSTDETVLGIKDLVEKAKIRIKNGMQAYAALQALHQNPNNQTAHDTLQQHADDLGYALLLKRYTPQVIDATPEQINAAAWDTVPSVLPIFWSFRVMVACGFWFIALFLTVFVVGMRGREYKPWLLRLMLLTLPLPWIAAELGWVVAEHGRQPWVIEGILPTFLGTSSLTAQAVYTSLLGFVVLYSLLTIVEMYLMVKYVRLGPEYVLKPTAPAPMIQKTEGDTV